MITFLDQKYPAGPKEVKKQEALIRSDRDDNNPIENLCQAIKEKDVKHYSR